DLIQQGVEFGVVPGRVVLGAASPVPGVEIIRGVEQGRYDGPDSQIVMPGGDIVEPYRFYDCTQVALDIEALLQHCLDGLRPELEAGDVAHHEIQTLDPVGMTCRGQQRAPFLESG